MNDTNIGNERSECSRHGWSSSNPFKNCPHCNKEDDEIKNLRQERDSLKIIYKEASDSLSVMSARCEQLKAENEKLKEDLKDAEDELTFTENFLSSQIVTFKKALELAKEQRDHYIRETTNLISAETGVPQWKMLKESENKELDQILNPKGEV